MRTTTRGFDRGVALIQTQYESAIKPRLDLADETNIHEMLPAHSQKTFGVEPCLQSMERPLKKRSMFAKINARIVTLRFKEANLAHTNKPAAVSIF